MAGLTGKRWPVVGKRLHMEFPYIDAEVRYAVKEYACTTVDVLARRLRLSFLNVQVDIFIIKLYFLFLFQIGNSRAKIKN